MEHMGGIRFRLSEAFTVVSVVIDNYREDREL